MHKPRLLIAMRGDYIREPSKGGLFFAREMALYLEQYMDVYLLGEDKQAPWSKGVWRERTIGEKSFYFFDIYSYPQLPLPRPFDTFLSIRLFKDKLKSIDPDILYLQEMDFLPLSSLEKPTVLHIHGCFKEMLALRYPPLWKKRKYLLLPRTNYVQGLFRLWLLKKYLPFLSRIFISASCKQIAYFKQKQPVIGAKMVSIPLMIDTHLFQPLDRGQAREVLGLPQEYFIILFVGGLDPLKAPHILLRSFSIFKKRVPNSLLIFIGKGSLEEYLRKQAEETGLNRDVLFLGRIPNEKLSFFYNASNVLVLPSLYEGISMVSLEALACGTPVVVSDIVGVGEFIKNGVEGFVIESVDVESLADTLMEVMKLSPESREQCRRVALKFSPPVVGELVYENFRSLLNE